MIDLVALFLRAGLGIMFFAHGLQMVFGMFGGPGIQGFAGYLSSLGFSHPPLWSTIAAYTTLIGGLFLILGVLVRLAAFFLFIYAVVATIKVHLANGFFIQSGGFEYTFVIACVCLALMVSGAGKFSVTRSL